MRQDKESPFQDQYEDSDSSEPEQMMRPIPVRQASVGRKSTPVLTTIKNGDLRPDNMSYPMVDMSPDERSEESFAQLSTRTSSSDILGRDAMAHGKSIGDKSSFSAFQVLNVDAVREAEARGSLTSLSDLIRRATKVASNLDRGRTASRLGLNFFDDDARQAHASDSRRSGSLSDILASFPPPGLATPTGSRGSRGGSRNSRAMPWSSNLQHSSLPSASDLGEEPERKRRCCGMPSWLFFTLLLLMVILIAAAIIIPIVLVVIPQQNNASGSASASALATCQKSLDCKNGGINILGSDGSCSCLCVNGFAGSECTQPSSASCTTTTIGSYMTNVTLGNSIPRLFTGSAANFSIPLNATNILGLFASSKLTCTSENALVTFNGLSARSISEDISETKATPTKVLMGRGDATSVAGAAVTSNGIVFASGSPSDSSSSSTSSSFDATTSSLTSSSSALSDSTTLDFARIAVLFVFQQSGQLNNAIAAQENLQNYFTSGTTSTGQQIDSSNIDLGADMSANLQTHSVTLANGTVTGG
ncbi:unnamed protein product [Aureobasidium vineae]|uniref:EGF-like domain-containing protein n=1 Tax=Aureobasidium vineae TaxID=2773715 RepID=A0A9N8JI11_9PEZI|nr:unnamed protein product [Aureobasidium vineae]